MKNLSEFVYDIRDITTLKEMFEGSVELYADRTAFLFGDAGRIREITYEEAFSEMKALATYLRSVVPEGSKVAVIGKNSYHWAITYLAVTCGVGVIVPLDKDLRADEISGLLADSGAVAMVYSSEQQEKVNGLENDCLFLGMENMDEYLERGRELLAVGDRSYENHKIDPHALGILLYTSGTTGVAKGVMLSQYNICSDIVNVLRRVKVYPTDRVLSIAPLHHTYECTVGFLCVTYSGASIAYNSTLRKIQAELKLYKPTILAAVPLILETFRNAIVKKYRQMKGGNAILSVQRKLSDLTGNKAGKKIFSVVNETFGGNLRLIVCGAALLAPEIFKDYERFGVRILIGYGLTETAPVCLMHNDFYNAPDDIGYPMPSVKVRLEDVNEEGIGELVVKGPNVMLGYYNNPEETARVMEDGWFHTGDLARKTSRGTYQIAGRAKSMIVTPGGKKVFPEELELYLMKSPYVCECMVYESKADGSPKITASLYPNEDEVAAKLGKDGFTAGTPEYEEEERKLLQGIVSAINVKFPNYKHIGRLVIRRREFEKTTTKKIRRNAEDNLKED